MIFLSALKRIIEKSRATYLRRSGGELDEEKNRTMSTAGIVRDEQQPMRLLSAVEIQ